MRLISGCLKPTQLPWLPVLSNVAPPSLRRTAGRGVALSGVSHAALVTEIFASFLGK